MERPGSEQLLERALALPAVSAVVARLDGDAGPRVALVGGAVRDLLLGRPVDDLDLLVDGPVEPVVARLGGPARSHVRFGTATVAVEGHRVDLARARRERYPRPGALPVVAPATLEEDLERRDFTVNALALPVSGQGAGQLLAVPRARQDLERRQLRVLHAASFLDDPTRLFRLARYRSRLGFELEPETQRLAAQAIGGGALGTIAGTRIGHELLLLCQESEPLGAWSAVGELGLDEAVEPGFGIRDSGLARRALALMPPDGRPQVLLMALATAGVPEGARRGLLERLGLPAEVRDGAMLAAARAPAVGEALASARRPSEIEAAVEHDDAPELVALAGALGAEEPAREWLERLRHQRLEIGGSDLLAAGVRPGPAVGAGLAAARAAMLDGRGATREEQLTEALRAAGGSG